MVVPVRCSDIHAGVACGHDAVGRWERHTMAAAWRCSYNSAAGPLQSDGCKNRSGHLQVRVGGCVLGEFYSMPVRKGHGERTRSHLRGTRCGTDPAVRHRGCVISSRQKPTERVVAVARLAWTPDLLTVRMSLVQSCLFDTLCLHSR